MYLPHIRTQHIVAAVYIKHNSTARYYVWLHSVGYTPFRNIHGTYIHITSEAINTQ